MSSVSKRYAKALLTLGREDGDRGSTLEDLQTLKGPLEDQALRDFLSNPAIPVAIRQETLFEIARRARVRPFLLQFLAILMENSRMVSFSEIVEHYERLLQRELGQIPVRIVSATPLDAEERERLLAKLQERIERELVVRTEVDPALIAGVQVEVAGKVYDGSIKNQLEKIKERIALAS
jgi:F-type H+-transporting ATPase subunit delta